MGTFIQNFIQNQKSNVLTSAKGMITNQYQKINEALTRYKQQLLESNPRYDSLICALTQDPSFISDDMLSEGSRNITDCLSPSDISEDDALDLYHGVMDAITNDGETNENGLTLTDAKGYCYNFINQVVGDEPYNLDGNMIYLSSSLVPSNLGEAILYRDVNGQFHLNNVIRTSDFVKRNAEIVPATTCLGKVITCCYIKGLVIPSDIQHGIESLLDDSSTVNTISGAINKWGLENDYTFSATSIYERLDEIESFYIEQWSAVGHGSFTSIWSVFSDLIESSTLNTAIVSTIQAVQSFGNFSIDYFSTLAERIGTKYNSVKDFFVGARDAFLKGGFTGLGTYILSYVKAISSLTDDNGLISFSDNKDLVPQQYIAGLVFQIISAVVTVIGVIVSIFSKIIGIAITILGGIFGAIAQAISADADQQYAAIQIDDSVILPIAPYALFQMSIYTSTINSGIISLLKNGAELVAQEVPGGYVIIGPSKTNEEYLDNDNAEYWEKYPECIYKFYPSVVPHNKLAALRKFLQAIDSNEHIFSVDSWDSAHWFKVNFNKDCVRNYLAANNLTCDDICQLYVDAAEDAEYLNASDGKLKDSTQIQLLTDTIIQNITWFIMWVISTRGYVSDWVNSAYAYPYNNDRADFYSDDDEWFSYLWTIPYCCDDDHYYHMPDGVHLLGSFISQTAWEELGHYSTGAAKYPSVKINPNAKPWELRWLINQHHAIDYALEVPSRMNFVIKVPKYDPDTFWFWVVFSAIILVAVTVVAVVATLKAKKAINRKRAQNQAAVEASWERLKNNPSDENYDAYRKTVKRNNRWATLIGGTKYDYVNYWNGDVSSSNDGSTSGSILSGLDSGQSSLDPVSDSNSIMTDDNVNVDINLLKKLITGLS